MPASFVHLRLHTEYSLVDGLVRIKPLVKALTAMNMPAVAVTDQNNMCSLVKFYKNAMGAGIKPICGADLWLANDAALLKAETARVYAQSLDIAIADLHAKLDSGEPFRTVRYPEGGTEKMERSQVIAQQCSHLVLRTLRGDVLAVPRKATDDSCQI